MFNEQLLRDLSIAAPANTYHSMGNWVFEEERILRNGVESGLRLSPSLPNQQTR